MVSLRGCSSAMDVKAISVWVSGWKRKKTVARCRGVEVDPAVCDSSALTLHSSGRRDSLSGGCGVGLMSVGVRGPIHACQGEDVERET
jgi:hypothetical protein